MRLQWLLAAAFFALIMAYLHVEAMIYFLYWRYEWFDIPMHFLGGLTIATFLIGFFVTRKIWILMIAFFAAIIGWEVFEYVFGMLPEGNYPLDTALDLVMDTIGGAVAYVVARITIWRSH